MKGNKRTFTVRTWKRTDNLSDASLLEAEIERRDGAEFPCRISASQLSFPVIQRIHPFQVNMRTNLQSCKKKKLLPIISSAEAALAHDPTWPWGR